MIFGNIIQVPPPQSGKMGFPWNQEVPVSKYNNWDENQYPKISIITIVHNHADYLEQTIRSVVLQNYPHVEYILIDEGSIDESLAIIEKYERFITHFETVPNTNASNAFEKALAIASGDILVYLKPGDYFTLDALRTAGELMVKEQADLVHLSTHIADESGNILAYDLNINLGETYLETIAKIGIEYAATFIRLDKIKQLNGLNTNLPYIKTWDLYVRYLFCFKQKGIVYSDFVGMVVQKHQESEIMEKTIFGEISKFEYNTWQVLRALVEKDYTLAKALDDLGFQYNATFAKDYPIVALSDLQMIISNKLFFKVAEACALGEYKRAHKMAKIIKNDLLNSLYQKDYKKMKTAIFFKKWFSKY